MSAAEVRDEIERVITMHMLRLTTNEDEVRIVAPTATEAVCQIIRLPGSFRASPSSGSNQRDEGK